MNHYKLTEETVYHIEAKTEEDALEKLHNAEAYDTYAIVAMRTTVDRIKKEDFVTADEIKESLK